MRLGLDLSLGLLLCLLWLVTEEAFWYVRGGCSWSTLFLSGRDRYPPLHLIPTFWGRVCLDLACSFVLAVVSRKGWEVSHNLWIQTVV